MGPGLGKRLTAAGLVDRGRLGAALALSTAEPMSLAEALVRLGVDPELIARTGQNATGSKRLSRAILLGDRPDVKASLPPSFIRRRLVLPVDLSDGVLVVATADPLDRSAIDEASRLARRPVRAETATVPDLLHVVRSRYGDLALPKARPTFVLGNRSSGAVPFTDESTSNARSPSPRGSMPPPPREPSSGAISLTESTSVELPSDSYEAWMRWDVAPAGARPRRSHRPPVVTSDGTNTRRKFEREQRSTPTPTEDLGAILATIRAAPNRDRVIELVLSAAMHHARQAFVFRVREGRLEGVDSSGSSLGAIAIRRIVLPLSQGSTPHRVLVDGQPHLGPLGVVPTDQVLRVAIGSRGGRISMHGVWIDGRPVAMLVADDVRTGELGHERLGAVCHAAGQSLKRLVRERV